MATDGPLADRKPFLAFVEVQAHGVHVGLDALHMFEDLLSLLRGLCEGVWPEWVEVSGVVRGGTECCFECLESIMRGVVFFDEGIAARAFIVNEWEGHDVVFSFVLVLGRSPSYFLKV